MNINELKQSNFLTKGDCGQGILVTIKHIDQQNVAMAGAPEELKYCIHFGEHEKPMVLNSTNAQLIAQIAKSEETDHWTGVKIVLYNDPSIMFGGKVCGGIRVRAPRGKAAAQQSAPVPKPAPVQREPEPVASEGEDDPEIPF